MNERIKAKHCQGKRFANYVDYIGTIMHSKLIILIFQSDKKEQQRLANKIILSEKNLLYHSKSYSKEFVAIIFSSEFCSVDIEYKRELSCRERKVLFDFIHNENDDVDFDNTDISNYILKIWTLKEAYSKYLQRGLYLNLSEIIVHSTNIDGKYSLGIQGYNTKEAVLLEDSDYFTSFII